MRQLEEQIVQGLLHCFLNNFWIYSQYIIRMPCNCSTYLTECEQWKPLSNQWTVKITRTDEDLQAPLLSLQQRSPEKQVLLKGCQGKENVCCYFGLKTNLYSGKQPDLFFQSAKNNFTEKTTTLAKGARIYLSIKFFFLQNLSKSIKRKIYLPPPP